MIAVFVDPIEKTYGVLLKLKLHVVRAGLIQENRENLASVLYRIKQGKRFSYSLAYNSNGFTTLASSILTRDFLRRELRIRQPTKFLLNICSCLFMSNLIFLFGIGNLNSSTGCYVSTALLQYFLLATWFWMSSNAYNLCKAVTMVCKNRVRKHKKHHLSNLRTVSRNI